MIDKNSLSKFGIGAWGLGGFAQHDPNNNDKKQINALVHTLSKGINFVEINFWNSEGHSVEIIKKAIDEAKIAREKLFLVQAIYDYNNPTLADAEREFNNCLKKFETDQIDSLEFPLTAIGHYGFKNVVDFIQKQIASKKIRYTSVTNFNLENLKKYHQVFKDKLFSHELCYNFEIRENEAFGITKYALDYGIINTPYQPTRRNRTAQRNWPLLVELARKYGKTQNQVILNWIVSKDFRPLIKSENTAHIDENLAALNFKMEKEDLQKLNDFKVPEYKSPKIDWFMTGNGSKIHALPNEFDTLYPA